ncbi:MAG: chemoreceptor glutamine deamidase CheD [Sterolibacteriaceae bacterium MAG5]|nr:chemoreceptor glutamine deamidase CheD [Candidatus Nitricoxidireducens bremensis]
MNGTAELGFVEHLAGNRYFDRQFEVEAVKVLPGEYYVTASNMVLVTVLGSCVSACVRDREKGVGGMNHFMLADSGDNGALSASARYGTYAMEILINHLLKIGARKSALEAKVFGGGRVMASLTSSQVGERNARFVMDFLATEGIPVAAQDLLDVYPRKVYYFPDTGRVLVKKLVRMHNDTLMRREKEYAARLVEAPVAGEIELFT